MKHNGIKVSVARGFKVMEKVGNLLSPNDPEVVRRFAAHVNEQDNWNDLFSTKLIEVLDKIDAVRSDARAALRESQSSLTSAQELNDATSRKVGSISGTFSLMAVVAACSWVATVWALWLAFQLTIPTWAPIMASAAIGTGTILVVRRLSHEA